MLRGMYIMDFVLSTKSGEVMEKRIGNGERKIKSSTSDRAWRTGIYREL